MAEQTNETSLLIRCSQQLKDDINEAARLAAPPETRPSANAWIRKVLRDAANDVFVEAFGRDKKKTKPKG